LRATLDFDRVTPVGNQASGASTSMAWADCLMIVPAESEGLAAGEDVTVIPLAEI
jgi:molybdopterin biosynthesis enzyme